MARYKSSIPPGAEELVVVVHPNGSKAVAQYSIAGERVGRRGFHDTGEIEWEEAYKNGKRHGRQYRWDAPGQLLSVEPFEDGLPHGIARQYDAHGHLVGTYRMRRGTGIDLWWHERFDGAPGVFLAEAIYHADGSPHGYEWWIDEDQRGVHHERHWKEGSWHGVERQWNQKRRLRRGFPKYWINSVQVTKRQYTAACKRDPTLPVFRERDNAPRRQFPREVAAHLRHRRQKP